jgi:sialidase-1
MNVEKAIGDYIDFRIPGLVVTENGTLLRYCECRRAHSDWADIDIKICRSTDEGETWETVHLVKSEGNTLNNPVMFVFGEKLIFLYCKNYKEIWKCVSEDDGQSFGKSERVDFENSVEFFYNAVAVGPGHGIVHNSRLLAPVWFAQNKERERSHHPSSISTIYSDDGGESWKIGELIFQDKLRNPSECALAITAENEVLISIRHEGEIKKRALAKSRDGISAWKDFRFEENLSDPTCMGSMTHRGGIIYHSNCDSSYERKNLTVKISDDCFITTQNIPVSDIAGYSDIAIWKDKLFIFYEKTVLTGIKERPMEPFELFFEVIHIPN